MKCAIMQPYLFPYLGYFQLIHAVDVFVSLDDVKYVPRRWINRNRILAGNTAKYFTFSLKKDSSKLNINERFYVDDLESQKTRFFNLLRNHYRKAPLYIPTISLLERILDYDDLNVAAFNLHTLKTLSQYLGITTEFLVSSELDKDNSLKASDKVININQRLNAEVYINPIGGIGLYSREQFARHHIKLNFLKTNPITYPQFDHPFIPDLSVVDVMMFNDKNVIPHYLEALELV